MTALYAAALTLIASLSVAAIALAVSHARFPKADPAQATASVYRTRRIYFFVLAGLAVIALAVSLPLTPYPLHFTGQTPGARVNVTGEMWNWTLTPEFGTSSSKDGLVLPVRKLVEFDVTSQDVNHDFAIYNASGRLLAQVQAMPNYTNSLFYRFEAPGRYYIICLEYCGVGHHAMNTAFDVR